MSNPKERVALFAGSFDPYTVGHHNIVERALALFDRIVVAVGYNSEKSGDASPDERCETIAAIYAGEPRVSVEKYDGLTADFARRCGAQVLLRGVRSAKDFEYERDLAEINRTFLGIETLLMPCDARYAAVSSSVVRELKKYGKDISDLLPEK